jgi:hypothetical protein
MISNKPLLATACSRARTAAFKLALDSASLNRGLGSMGIPVLGGGFNHGGRAFMFLLSALAFGGIFGCALGTVTRHRPAIRWFPGVAALGEGGRTPAKRQRR